MASSSSSPAQAPAAEPLRQKRILSSKLYLEVPSSKVGRGVPSLVSSPQGIAPATFPSRVSIALFSHRRRWCTLRPTTSRSSGSRRCELPSRLPTAAYAETHIGVEMRCVLTLRACRHPFDSAKWGRICRYLAREGHLDKKRVVEPLEASKDDLLVVINQQSRTKLPFAWCILRIVFVLSLTHGLANQVHTEAYLNSLKSSFRVSCIVEVVYFFSPQRSGGIGLIGGELCSVVG